MTHGDPSVNALYGAYARGEITLERLREIESGREGLDGAAPDAPRDGSADSLYGPGDFDHLRPGAGDPGDSGRRDPRVDLMTREELEARKLRILQLWDVFEPMQANDYFCCDGCGENDIWLTYGPEAAEVWCELQEIRYLLGERGKFVWTS